MEGDLVDKRLIFTLSLSWLGVRLAVAILTPFFLAGECDEELMMFLRLVFYTTVISVFAQLAFYTYIMCASCRSKERKVKMQVMMVQIVFYSLDYLIYGLCRFAIFIAGAIWLTDAEDCDDSVWAYCLVLVVGYFTVFWLICCCGFMKILTTWWDSYTL